MKYDYKKNIIEDIKERIYDYKTKEEIQETTKEDLYEELYDEFWIDDSVTGNASGSYYCNTWRAEEALYHNMDLLEEALNEFGSGLEDLQRGAEFCDVTIRCYLLSECLYEALDELKEEMENL